MQRITDALSRYVGVLLRALHVVYGPVYKYCRVARWPLWGRPADSSGPPSQGRQPAPDVDRGATLTVITRCVHDNMPQPRR
jgi:hypothetical protein